MTLKSDKTSGALEAAEVCQVSTRKYRGISESKSHWAAIVLRYALIQEIMSILLRNHTAVITATPAINDRR
jgi:ABC-type transport system involved in cytochrome c biogenesis permease component